MGDIMDLRSRITGHLGGHAVRILWASLGAPDRRRALALSPIIVLGTVSEMVGIGAVLPVMAILVGAGGSTTLARLPAGLAIEHRSDLVTIAMIALIGLFAVKALFQAYLTKRINRFSFGLQAGFSAQLYACYLHQPYEFHLSRNSAHLASTIHNEARDAAVGFNNALVTAAELFSASGIVVLLILVSPIAGLATAVITGLAGLLIILPTRSLLTSHGAALRHHNALKQQQLQQGLHSVKEVLLLGREKVILDQFEVHNRASAEAAEHSATLNAMPRLWLELLAVTAMALIVLVLQWQGQSNLIPVLGFFAAAAFRLSPSIYRILNGLQAMRYFGPTMIHVAHELALEPGTSRAAGTAPLLFDRELTLDHVTYRYPGAGRDALSEVSLRIAKGAMTGVVGSSGAGKSTLVDVILGLLVQQRGAVRVDGVPIHTNLGAWQRLLGYVPQTIYLTDDTLRRNIAFGIDDAAIDDAAVQRAIRLAQLGDWMSQLPAGLASRMGDRGLSLSGGQRQRVGIARALYHAPQVLVMDEGTNALDLATETDLMQTLAGLRGAMTIIAVSHRPSALKDCDQVVHLKDGVVRAMSASLSQSATS